MRTGRHLRWMIVAGGAAVLLGPSSAAAAPVVHRSVVTLQVSAGAAAVEPLQLELEVSHLGFNGGEDMVIEAAAGQAVQLTFLWADTAVPDNTHTIRIEGYDLTTGVLSESNQRETLTFDADRTGTFEIVCVTSCRGHGLLQARFAVTEEVVTLPPAALATSVALDVSNDDGGGALFSALVLGPDGNPVSGAEVVFELNAELAGVSGFVEIGRSTTDARGVAVLAYDGAVPPADGRVQATFAGVGAYQGSTAEVADAVPNSTGAYVPDTTPLTQLMPWGRLLFLSIVLAMWGTIAYVVVSVLRLRHSLAPPATEREST